MITIVIFRLCFPSVMQWTRLYGASVQLSLYVGDVKEMKTRDQVGPYIKRHQLGKEREYGQTQKGHLVKGVV